jgi:imidazoleglycerol phosphate dehydratase HisB
MASAEIFRCIFNGSVASFYMNNEVSAWAVDISGRPQLVWQIDDSAANMLAGLHWFFTDITENTVKNVLFK